MTRLAQTADLTEIQQEILSTVRSFVDKEIFRRCLQDEARHVAFGMGLHQCIGQPIARLEIELVLKALVARATTLELDGDPVPELHNTLHFFTSIPLKVSASA